MIGPTGQFLQPPPPYPPIRAGTLKVISCHTQNTESQPPTNLQKFIAMPDHGTSDDWIGKIFDLHSFLTIFG